MPEGFGFKAWVSTDDGKALPEYGVETDSKKKEVSCWIPSEEGKKFKVVWNNLAHYKKDTGGRVKVDGTDMGGIFVSKSNSIRVSPTAMEDVVTSPTSVRKFVFSPLKLTDDDSLLGASHEKDIGSISLELHEVAVGEVTHAVWTVHEQSTVNERSKKGFVHRVGFGPEEKRNKTETTNLADDIQKFGTFVFDVLQANGIAPRDSPPSRTVSTQPDTPSQSEAGTKRKADAIKEEDDGESGNEKEARELERLRARVRELEEKRANAKRVKSEPRPAFVPGEVIDLT